MSPDELALAAYRLAHAYENRTELPELKALAQRVMRWYDNEPLPDQEPVVDWVRYDGEGEWHAEMDGSILCGFEFASVEAWFHRTVSGPNPAPRCVSCIRAVASELDPPYPRAETCDVCEEMAGEGHDQICRGPKGVRRGLRI